MSPCEFFKVTSTFFEPFPLTFAVILLFLSTPVCLKASLPSTVIIISTVLATLLLVEFPSSSLYPPVIDFTSIVNVASLDSETLFTVIVIVVPSCTSVPASLLCLNTTPSFLDSSSSLTTLTFNPASVNKFLASCSVFPTRLGTSTFTIPLPLLTTNFTVLPLLTVSPSSIS